MKIRTPNSYRYPLTLLTLAGVFTLICTSLLAQQKSEHVAPTDSEQTKATSVLGLCLTHIRPLTTGDGSMAPQWSPVDANLIAFVNQKGTFVVSVDSGQVRQITPQMAGYKFFWTKDGKFLVSSVRSDQSRTPKWAVEFIKVDTGLVSYSSSSRDISLPQEVKSGVVRYFADAVPRSTALSSSSKSPELERSFVYQSNNAIFAVTNGVSRQITHDAGIYFGPQLSPDNSRVLFEETGSGILVADLTGGNLLAVARGSNPAWSPDGTLISFNVTSGDGDSISSSDIYVADLKAHIKRLTYSPSLLAMEPSWSPDGKRLAFSARGAIYVADFRRGCSE